MNFTNNVKIVLMGCIFCVSTINATWGASLMGLGQKLKTSVTQHKVVAGVSAILVGIYTFNKCVDYIFRRKVAGAVEAAKCRVKESPFNKIILPDYKLFSPVSMWPHKKAMIKITLNPTDQFSSGLHPKAMIVTDISPYGYDEAKLVF